MDTILYSRYIKHYVRGQEYVSLYSPLFIKELIDRERTLRRKCFNATIDLHRLGRRLLESNRSFIRVEEIAYEFGISHYSAGKLLAALSRLGYVEKWSNGLYRIVRRSRYARTLLYRVTL